MNDSSAIRLGLLFALTLALSACSWLSVTHCTYWNLLPAMGINYTPSVCPGGQPTQFTKPTVTPIENPVTLQVSPRVSVAPVPELHLRVWVVPDDANRALLVTGSSEDFGRSSMESLDGAHASRVHDLWWKRIPCGRYDFAAAVLDQGGHARRSTSERAVFCRDADGL